MLDIGKVCIKIAGREAGKLCTVVKKVDENFVMITGPRELTGVKRRKCNIVHLEPLEETMKIKSDAPDSEVMNSYSKDLLQKFKLVIPTKEDLKKMEAQRAEKEKARKEREAREAKELAKKQAEEKKRLEEKKAKAEKEKAKAAAKAKPKKPSAPVKKEEPKPPANTEQKK